LSIDAAQFRTVIGHFATGVTVVTTAAGEEMQGMTANAVTSLSLDPLMLLVCVEKNTHTHRVLQAGGMFAVNVLGEHQEDVSRLFAQRAEPEIGSLRGQRFRLGRTGAPILEDCMAYLECETASQLDGGDHTIFVGRVVEAEVVREAGPLIFFRSQYARLDRPAGSA